MSRNVTIRLSNPMYQQLSRLANAAGLSRSEVIRLALNNERLPTSHVISDQAAHYNYSLITALNSLYSVIWRSGNNINQIARAINSNNYNLINNVGQINDLINTYRKVDSDIRKAVRIWKPDS